MKGKLQKSWVLSSIVLMGLTTTLPSVNMVLAETVNETQNTKTQDVTLPYDNLLEAPTSESSDSQQESTVEEQPTFSLEKEQMVGTIGETTEVVILVDRPTSQVQVTIPQEITIQKEELSEGLEVTQMTETEWWFSADERTKFTIPVSSETAGKFTIRVEDELDGVISFKEAADDETNDESVETDETDSTNETENSVIPEVQEKEDAPAEETEDITPATTSNVSTWAQFRTAINNNSVTMINVNASISGNTTLNNVSRNLTINGNGNTINLQGQSIRVNRNDAVIAVRNATISSSSSSSGTPVFSNSNANNVTFTFSDITYSSVVFFVGATSDSLPTNVIFDGGISSFSRSGTASTTILANGIVTIKNGASVKTDNRWLIGTYTGSTPDISNRISLTIEKGSSLTSTNQSHGISISTLNIEGILDVSGSANGFQQFDRATEPMRINLGEESQVIIQKSHHSDTSSQPIVSSTVGTEISISKGAKFDFLNSGSGGILTENQSHIVNISTENLAVWKLGKSNLEMSNPSQNFENLEAYLTGTNASTITETNHNVFRSTYSKQGMAGYSRISSSGIAEEGPVDPLAPDTEIDPDNPPMIPENQGNFRLDFVSQFTFGSHERNMFEEETYYALPQYGLDSNGEVIESEPKPNFVQITDNRADADGWQLSVTQREQFKTETGNELSGASLQLKNRQLVADHDGQQPQEATTEETIVLEPGAKQPLLTSSTGEGKGTWIYRFGDGASSDQSVALVVPKETIPEATTYQTKLDWELQAVPSNE